MSSLTISDSHAPAPLSSMKCRICGCSERNACVVDDMTCSWIAAELCDFCATIVGQSLLQGTFPAQELHQAPWLLSIFNTFYADDLYLRFFEDLQDYAEALRALAELADKVEPRVVCVSEGELNLFLRARGAL